VTQANEQIVRAFLAAISNEGLDAARKKYASPDLIWWVAGVGEIQQQMDELIAAFARHFEEPGMKMEVHDTTSEGDKVAVEAESHATLNNGSRYNNHYHFLFRLRAGKIAHIKEYHDTKHAVEALAPILAELSA
jgi:ketosteroid isomerase-like protein